jgi:hypothetical protein
MEVGMEERTVRIEDHTIWFKHVADDQLRGRLESLSDNQEIMLLADGVVGRWKRMRTGSDGRPVLGIKPDGAMKSIWEKWFRNRKGEEIQLREVALADDYLVAGSALFSEWNSPEDDEAFRDL